MILFFCNFVIHEKTFQVMAIQFLRKKFSRVLPSGVPVTLQAFVGKHQAIITNNDAEKRKEGIAEMMADCIVSLGNVPNPSKDVLNKLLINDRAYILFETRQESNTENDSFTFDYEFASQGKKRKQRYKIEFNKEDFPQRPYKWVHDAMVETYRIENELTGDLTQSDFDNLAVLDFPQIYDSYDQMLEDQKKRELILPSCKVKIEWHLVDVKREDMYTRGKTQTNSHDQLLMRSPMYYEGEKKVVLGVGALSQMSIPDIEAIRKSIMETEGNIDTSVVIRYGDDDSTSTQINLIAIPAFFFPSLAT